MALHIQFCSECDSYSLSETCPTCGNPTHRPHPPKFSPEDKYAEYRREYKETAVSDK
ncbi:RNA-protein complex protein Nop10 [Candidatus Woesearchaeota archaeon]|nr:RNA-protein complex protein Nop10 [Candidatus Woesearchaeota archaeon]